MRNLFDQYDLPENRLTHALASCLAKDATLLRQFVTSITGKSVEHRLKITVQSLPGESEPETDEEQRSLPDAWIYSDDGYALLIESKIAAAPSRHQIRRHFITARRRGFKSVSVVLLVPGKATLRPSTWFHVRRWEDLYQWATKASRRSFWARQLVAYMEIAEAKLGAEGYLRQGGLTVFSGIPFSQDRPYTYLEGKRLLGLALDKLRHNKKLVQDLGMDPLAEGRPAITGKGRSLVWDFLRMRFPGRKSTFTSAPHLTLSISDERLSVHITIPNGVRSQYRKPLIEGGEERFAGLLRRVHRGLTRSLRGAPGAVPWIQILQRHYPSQRSHGIEDAKLAFDTRTAFASRGPVRYQPEWLNATYRAFSRKRSNIQFMVGADFPYVRCPVVRTPKIIEHIGATWLACVPLIDVMRGRRA